jgi:acyl-CoA reductase-like NAD-dependent aldehyde dehydrogenase
LCNALEIPSRFHHNLRSFLPPGRQEVANLAFGGELLKRHTPGFDLQPALFTEATNAIRTSGEEIAGPVASVIRARDYHDTTHWIAAVTITPIR